MGPTKDEIARQFGRMAEAYAASPAHARGADLEIVIGLLEPHGDTSVLDVATGAGHTAAAAARLVREVTAIDLAPEMIRETWTLAAARGLSNVRSLVMDAEAMGFRDAAFDAVTCRVAPHHFPDPAKAVREIGRVLRPGGRFVLEDSCAPAGIRDSRSLRGRAVNRPGGSWSSGSRTVGGSVWDRGGAEDELAGRALGSEQEGRRLIAVPRGHRTPQPPSSRTRGRLG